MRQARKRPKTAQFAYITITPDVLADPSASIGRRPVALGTRSRDNPLPCRSFGRRSNGVLKPETAIMINGGVLSSEDDVPGQASWPVGLRSHLVCQSIGVRATQAEAVELAFRHGFDAVEARIDHLVSITGDAVDALVGTLAERRLTFGGAGLPVDFHGDEEAFRSDLVHLTAVASRLRRAGLELFWSWLAPCHDMWPFHVHLEQHVRRLRLVADVLDGEGFRLGLEYLGPKSLRTGWRHPFIHTLSQTLDLITAVGRPCLGVVLDSFHWYAACESADDLRAMPHGSVVAIDLSDAPAGIPPDGQRDDVRELPCATGVIDVAAFLRAAVSRAAGPVPVRAEPFNAALNALPAEQAVALAADSLRRARALLGEAGGRQRDAGLERSL